MCLKIRLPFFFCIFYLMYLKGFFWERVHRFDQTAREVPYHGTNSESLGGPGDLVWGRGSYWEYRDYLKNGGWGRNIHVVREADREIRWGHRQTRQGSRSSRSWPRASHPGKTREKSPKTKWQGEILWPVSSLSWAGDPRSCLPGSN